MRRVFIIIGACLLASCGNLNVQVDVLDPNYLEREIRQPALRRQLEFVIAQTDDMIREALNGQRAEHRKYLQREHEDIVKRYRKLLPTADPRAVPALRATIDRLTDRTRIRTELDEIYSPAPARISASNNRIREAWKKMSPETRSKILAGEIPVQGDLAGLLSDRAAQITALRTQIANQIGNEKVRSLSVLQGAGAGATELRQVEARLQNGADRVAGGIRSLTDGRTLVDDPLAFAVANAEDKHWAKRYNRTLASGHLGDFDVAVKLESLGDFTIKGVAFDPSTVAQVAAKATTQALLVAAQIAGVPVAGIQGNGNGAALAKASDALATAQAKLDKRQALVEDYRAALLDLADAITRERAVIEGAGAAADDARKRAAAAIGLAFQEFRSRLDLSGL